MCSGLSDHGYDWSETWFDARCTFLDWSDSAGCFCLCFWRRSLRARCQFPTRVASELRQAVARSIGSTRSCAAPRSEQSRRKRKSADGRRRCSLEVNGGFENGIATNKICRLCRSQPPFPRVENTRSRFREGIVLSLWPENFCEFSQSRAFHRHPSFRFGMTSLSSDGMRNNRAFSGRREWS